MGFIEGVEVGATLGLVGNREIKGDSVGLRVGERVGSVGQ